MLGIKCRLTVQSKHRTHYDYSDPLKVGFIQSIEEEEGENLFCLQLKILSGLGH